MQGMILAVRARVLRVAGLALALCVVGLAASDLASAASLAPRGSAPNLGTTSSC